MNIVPFVGYVNSLVVESGLMQELPNAIFSEQLMRYEEQRIIDRVAGEKEADARKREKNTRVLKSLKDILKTLEYSLALK